MEEEDYKPLVIHILKSLRGKKSREQVSRKTTFSHRQIYRWERTGDIPIENFWHLCKYYGVDFKKVIRNIFTSYDYNVEIDSLDYVKHIFQGVSQKEISSLMNWSKSKTQRVFSEGQSIQAAEYFSLVSKAPGYLELFIKEILPPDKLGKYKKVVQRYEKLLKVISNEPLASIFCDLTKLDSYKKLKQHKDSFFSDFLNITDQKTEKVLKSLKELGVLTYDKKSQKYAGDFKSFSIASLSKDQIRKIVEYHLKRAIKYTRASQFHSKPDTIFSYANMLLDDDQLSEIREEFSIFYSKVYAISKRKSVKKPKHYYSMQLMFFDQNFKS